MGLLDDDLDYMLSDQVNLTGKGVVVWGAQTINATFGREERWQPDSSGSLMPNRPTILRVAVADLPDGAAREDAITVDKVSYRVRGIEIVEEGLVAEVLVQRG